MKPDISISYLLEQAQRLLARRIIEWHPATSGADHLVVFAKTADGQEVVLKAGLEANVDAFVLNRLAGTPIPVPTLLGFDAIEASGARHWLTIMTPAHGMLLAEVPDTTTSLRHLLSSVQRLHQVTTTQGAGLVLAVEEGATPSWTEYLLSVLAGTQPGFDWRAISAHPAIDANKLARVIAVIRDRVEALPDLPTLSLLHGDLNPFNIFVRDHRVTAIIDWSYARYGDPLFDFARLRMNPYIRADHQASAWYFGMLALDDEARHREETYYWFNLLEYINWYVQDGNLDRAREHLALLSDEVRC